MRFKVLILTLAILTTVAVGTSRATTIGPDAFGYSATNVVAFSFHDISATGTRVLNGNDDSFVSAAIGFTFNFYGTSYTTLNISSNGLISFGAGNTTFTNSDFSGGIGGTNDLPTIAPFWDDLEFLSAGTDAVYYQTEGAPGSRVMTVEWHQAKGFLNSPGAISFEARLFEGSGIMLFTYLNTNTGDGYATGASATVGIRNTGAPGNGDFLQWSFNQAIIPDESSILIVPGRPRYRNRRRSCCSAAAWRSPCDACAAAADRIDSDFCGRTLLGVRPFVFWRG